MSIERDLLTRKHRNSSRHYTIKLERRIRQLEAELQKNNLEVPPGESREEVLEAVLQESGTSQHESQQSLLGQGQKPRGRFHSLIDRLCAAEPRLCTDRAGRLHFYGPSSSLHTAESISSWFTFTDAIYTETPHQTARELPVQLQEHLLDQYWKFQHGVIQVVNREAFLNDMKVGRCQYYSKALLYAIFASAARVSDYPEIRALVVPPEAGSLRFEEPYLFKKASTLVEEELRHDASVTTVQALALLSVLCCCYAGSDGRGWMDSGRAVRLAFEFGLNQELSSIGPNSLRRVDSSVLRTTFWGCFTLDRLWATYLGRPYLIRLDVVTLPRPDASPGVHTWDEIIAGAWTDLLDIIGRICDSINHKLSQPLVMRQKLCNWRLNLDPVLRYLPQSPPAVHVLHLHYHSAVILERLSEGRFGVETSSAASDSTSARTIYTDHALQLAAITQDYRANHGSARTMIGNSLYNITIAVIVLIANWAEGGTTDENQYIERVDSCVRSIKEMETSFASARTLSNIVLSLMRRCNFPPLPSQRQKEWSEEDEGLLSRLRLSLPILSPDFMPALYDDQGLFSATFDSEGLESSGPFWLFGDSGI
ncbi:Fungal specific transcription factor domain-containing protein [Cladophialophora immunda]|nr:Fungal specific transcription factor domain-containing protein [Cladophialophora immunda]